MSEDVPGLPVVSVCTPSGWRERTLRYAWLRHIQYSEEQRIDRSKALDHNFHRERVHIVEEAGEHIHRLRRDCIRSLVSAYNACKENATTHVARAHR